MATWPAGLPAPQKKISITPGDTRTERKLQSGRTEFRRFGDGKPDQMKVLFRLLWAQWDIFKEFYERDLNLSLNWFSASWLAGLGYSDHKAKFLGYPREVARQGYYVDVVCTLMIQKTAWIIGEDTEWPCATTGGEPPPPDENGYIYGGCSNQSTQLRDCQEYTPDTWTTKSDMPTPARDQLAASTIDNNGYVYGGRDNGGSALQDCDGYTPDTWTTKSDMPAPARYSFGASTIGSSGYVYGGQGAFYDCDQYAPNAWVSKTNIPGAQRHHAASTIGDSGYIYGGNYPQGCSEYTPDTWTTKSDMPLPGRQYLAASTIGSSGYIYGGAAAYIQDCDEYTPDTWVSKTDMPAPARGRLAASTIGSSGYVYGGTIGATHASDPCTDCDEYTPSNNTWLSKTDIPGTAYDIQKLAASSI